MVGETIKDEKTEKPDALAVTGLDAHADPEKAVIDQAITEIQQNLAGAVILIVPGLGDSGAKHWQTLWEEELPDAVRVQQDDWNVAEKRQWVRKLDEYIYRFRDRKIILIAHSLACPTVAHLAQERSLAGRVSKALLVAPADVDIPVEGISGFAPMPLQPIPFDTMVVASANDLIVSIERAEFFAESWNAAFRNVGAHGHINAASGLGDWPEGLKLLAELLEKPTTVKIQSYI